MSAEAYLPTFIVLTLIFLVVYLIIKKGKSEDNSYTPGNIFVEDIGYYVPKEDMTPVEATRLSYLFANGGVAVGNAYEYIKYYKLERHFEKDCK